MESALPQSFPALLALAFLLGAKHGIDPDHLATVDGLTRYNAARNARFARWCGALFSLGHGLVVVLVAGAVAGAAATWQVPGWMDHLGAWISMLFLFGLGSLNLAVVLATDPRQAVAPVGFKGRFLGRFARVSHPGMIMLVGALFALSFDTLSQAAVFSLVGSGSGGMSRALALGFAFMAGMLLTDGANGLWISRLLRSADRRAVAASRIMGLTVGGLSLLVGLLTLARYLSAHLDERLDGSEMLLGLALTASLAAAFALALRRAASPLGST